MHGTKPCISFTKRTLWLHRPPWGVKNHWVSSLFSHMDGPKPCISMENVHFACIGLPMVSKFVGNPTLCLHRAPLWCQKSIQTSPILPPMPQNSVLLHQNPLMVPQNTDHIPRNSILMPSDHYHHHHRHKTIHLPWETQIVFLQQSIDSLSIHACHLCSQSLFDLCNGGWVGW